MRARCGWTLAAWVLGCACGSSDPDPGFSAGGTSGSVTAGTQAVVGAAGSGGRSSGRPTTRAGSGGRSAGSAGITAGLAGRTGIAGRTGTAGVAASAGRAAAGSGAVAGTTSVAGTSGSVASATFAEVYTIFTNRCAGVTCHVGANGAGGDGLNMADRMTAYRALVGTNSASCRNEKRVVAGNPDRSVLLHTIARTSLGACSPPQMPLALPKLPQTEIDTVSAWIRGGALNN